MIERTATVKVSDKVFLICQINRYVSEAGKSQATEIRDEFNEADDVVRRVKEGDCQVVLKKAQELAFSHVCGGKTMVTSFAVRREVVMKYDGDCVLTNTESSGEVWPVTYFGEVVSAEVLTSRGIDYDPNCVKHAVETDSGELLPLDPSNLVYGLKDLDCRYSPC